MKNIIFITISVILSISVSYANNQDTKQLQLDNIAKHAMSRLKPGALTLIVKNLHTSETIITSIDKNETLRHDTNLLFEPGSTIKPFIVLTALDKGVITSDLNLHTDGGTYKVSGHYMIKDRNKDIETMNISDILLTSSNIAVAKIADMLSSSDLYDGLQQFGFTKLPIRKHFENDLIKTTTSEGFGFAVTPQEMCNAYGMFLKNNPKRMIDQKHLNYIEKILETKAHQNHTKLHNDSDKLPNHTGLFCSTTYRAKHGRYVQDTRNLLCFGFTSIRQIPYSIGIIIQDKAGNERNASKIVAPLFFDVLRILNISK